MTASVWLARLFGQLGLDPRWLEAFSGVTGLLWAVIVLLGPERLTDYPAYVPLASFAPEWLWISIVGAGALAQMAAARKNHIEARLMLAMAMGSIYLLLAFGLRQGSPWSPSIPGYLGWGIGNAAAMLLLAATWLRRRDDRRRGGPW